jgi:hypothetical protein
VLAAVMAAVVILVFDVVADSIGWGSGLLKSNVSGRLGLGEGTTALYASLRMRMEMILRIILTYQPDLEFKVLVF